LKVTGQVVHPRSVVACEADSKVLMDTTEEFLPVAARGHVDRAGAFGRCSSVPGH